MNFSSDAIAKIEGLLEVNRDFCEQQMAEKASPASPPNKSAFTKGVKNQRLFQENAPAIAAFPLTKSILRDMMYCT
ncbi:MAG: hypothetical protein IKJ65_10625 [Clostridia bacterium]|nr:hypothetical protein [Clostridia bacterium]